MTYKAVDIFKDLPQKKGCRDCGRPGCFAFATAVHMEGLSLSGCPHVPGAKLQEMEARLRVGRQQEGHAEGEKPEAHAARMLLEQLGGADLRERALAAQVSYVAGPSEQLLVEFFGETYRVERSQLRGPKMQGLDPWQQVMLLMYVLRAEDRPLSGQWVAFRELPNTISKQKTFESWVERLGEAFSQRLPDLVPLAAALGGQVVSHPSANLAIQFQAFSRVPLLLLLWAGDEDFPPRSSLLLDRNVLSFLDQEALTFLAEYLVRELLEF